MGWGAFLKAIRKREYTVNPLTWVMAGAAALYTIWPFDLLTDLLVPIGFIDDIGVWGIFVTLAIREKARWEAQALRGQKAGDGIIDV